MTTNPIARLVPLLLTLAASLAVAPCTADDAAPIFAVVSAATLQSSPLRDLPAQPRQDSLGTPLRLIEIDLDQRDLLTRHVHEQEGRCGGYFAFDSRAAAEAFLAGERSLQALLRPDAISYVIDNSDTILPWLPQVEADNLYATMAHLSSYQNRYYDSPHGLAAAEWIRDQWAALGQGRADVGTELFTGCTTCSTQPTVVLTVTGNELADEVVVVGAHLDSIRSGAGSNTQQFAPGADDDASGIAVITETLRIALDNGWRPQRTIKFMGYAAEEVGLRGSNAIAARFAADGVNVVGVLQLDMTNYRNGVPFHLHFISDYVNAPLLAFAKSLFDAYLAPLGLVRRDLACGYACSDHASWTSNGFPSVMASEPGDVNYRFFPGLHTANDTLATVGDNANASVPFVQFALAFIGEMAKTSSGDPTRIHHNGFEAAP
ncbi:MAG: M20/M25/M40 family metallo-hydrolase [Lysobacteraceae bacterium]